MDDGRLEEVGEGCWAWLQRDGGWGWSNAGLLTSEGRSLLVDTLYTLPLTARMLEGFAQVPGGERIEALVNTHANGDHCWGNQLLAGRPILATEACREELAELPPARMRSLVALARVLQHLPGLSELGRFTLDCFGGFDFSGITLQPPDRCFEERMTWRVGERSVELIALGPAHTRGDCVVHVPDAGVVYTGDLLFSGAHPIVWSDHAGWERACAALLALEPRLVVPGHGPLAGPAELRRLADYLAWLRTESRPRFEAGRGALDTALELADGPFRDWGEGERLAANVDGLFRSWRGQAPPKPLQAFYVMAAFRKRSKRR